MRREPSADCDESLQRYLAHSQWELKIEQGMNSQVDVYERAFSEYLAHSQRDLKNQLGVIGFVDVYKK